MSDVVELDKKARVREQASLWLIRLQEGLSAEQKLQLQQWVDADDMHGDALLEMASVWDDMGVLTELAPMFDGMPQKSTIDQQMQNAWGFKQRPWAYAAGIVIALLITLSVIPNPIFNFKNTYYQVAAKQQSYQTEIGEHSTVQLSDGSLVTLNTNSQILVDFNDTARNIRLIKGEAHFEVAKDESRPLSVVAGNNTVRAVGTAFNVMRGSKDNLEVAVNEGRVAVFSPAGKPDSWIKKSSVSETALVAGDVLTITDNEYHIRQYDAIEMENRLAWQDGMVMFEDDTLQEVIEELSRYNKVRILLEDERLGETRVAGYFRVGDIDALLIALKENFNIGSNRQDNNTIILSSL